MGDASGTVRYAGSFVIERNKLAGSLNADCMYSKGSLRWLPPSTAEPDLPVTAAHTHPHSHPHRPTHRPPARRRWHEAYMWTVSTVKGLINGHSLAPLKLISLPQRRIHIYIISTPPRPPLSCPLTCAVEPTYVHGLSEPTAFTVGSSLLDSLIAAVSLKQRARLVSCLDPTSYTLSDAHGD